MDKLKKFNKICKDIQAVKIQSARNIAKKAFFAYKLIPTKESKKKLLSLRPTEPLLANVLRIADRFSYREFLQKINENQEKINKLIFNLIPDNSIVFTHCHSSSVTSALSYAKSHGKKFEVYNTETRPLFQGRKTAKELRKAGIKVTMFVDSAAATAIEKENKNDKIHADLVIFGTDAITPEGVINKVGSGMFAEIAYRNKVPVYILADSWKYSPKIHLEQRSPKEIWNTNKIKIKNPAFELVKKQYIKYIITELGVLKYNDFLKKINCS
jgi:ribose 1,5-bisphosphate isomerase